MITHYRVDMRVVHGQTVTILKKSFPLNRIKKEFQKVHNG